MRWWCSAQGVPWEWVWRPYPGVWIALAGIVLAYLALAAAGRRRGGGPTAREWTALAAALLLLELVLDWPVGALGAGYLAAAHMAQFLVVAMLVPPLLLAAVPRGAWDALEERERARGVLAAVTRPVLALVVFNAVMVLTHLPVVADTLRRSQLGSFTLDALWLAAGLLLWWPVMAPVPARPRFGYGLRMGYLLVNTVPGGFLGAFLVYAGNPLYAVYELAPRVTALDAMSDQQVAGLSMIVIGAAIHWAAVGVLFYHWNAAEGGRQVDAPPLRARR